MVQSKERRVTKTRDRDVLTLIQQWHWQARELSILLTHTSNNPYAGVQEYRRLRGVQLEIRCHSERVQVEQNTACTDYLT